jgi:ribosomal protein S18 acetylase RimI-like enzyme
LPARPDSNVIFEAPPGRFAVSFFEAARRTVYGAAEFIRPFVGGAHAHLFGFYIDESLRGGGAASMFLAACEKRLSEGYSIRTIDLSVSEQNTRALAFYIKNGYGEAEKVEDYYGAGRDRLIMRKTVSGVINA